MSQNICHEKIKLILLDLDGTLLTTDKKISAANYSALEQAAATGIYIVPCTGRFFSGMPENVRNLPFLHYAITINGADICDVKSGRSIHSALISSDRAGEIFSALDSLPVIYDCFQDNWGWMDRRFYDQADLYEMGDVLAANIRKMRTPLENFKQTIKDRKRGVQKIQMFYRDLELRRKMLHELKLWFPDLVVTASLVNNIELNSSDAHKGNALLKLCQHLNIDPSETIAFGDGLNDLTMLKTAGIGVAMGNADQQLKDIADFVTDTNDHDGVAKAIMQLCFSNR